MEAHGAIEVSQLHAIRCCVIGELNTCYGSICDPTFITDGKAATLEQAHAECASRQQRLCEADELEARGCATWTYDRTTVSGVAREWASVSGGACVNGRSTAACEDQYGDDSNSGRACDVLLTSVISCDSTSVIRPISSAFVFGASFAS